MGCAPSKPTSPAPQPPPGYIEVPMKERQAAALKAQALFNSAWQKELEYVSLEGTARRLREEVAVLLAQAAEFRRDLENYRAVGNLSIVHRAAQMNAESAALKKEAVALEKEDQAIRVQNTIDRLRGEEAILKEQAAEVMGEFQLGVRELDKRFPEQDFGEMPGRWID